MSYKHITLNERNNLANNKILNKIKEKLNSKWSPE